MFLRVTTLIIIDLSFIENFESVLHLCDGNLELCLKNIAKVFFVCFSALSQGIFFLNLFSFPNSKKLN